MRFSYFDRSDFRHLLFLLLGACTLLGCSDALRMPDLKSAQNSIWDVFFESSKRVSAELLLAVKSGNDQLVDELLDLRNRTSSDDPVYLSVEAKDEKGWTPLMWAVHHNHFVIVNALIEAGANVDARGYDGSTPLALAIKNNHCKIFDLLLEKCEAVDIPDNKGVTPLMLAIAMNNLHFAEQLIDEDASPEVRDSLGNSAFTMAMASGNHRAIEVLLKGDTWKHIDTGTASSYYLDPLTMRRDSGDGTVLVWLKKIEATKLQSKKSVNNSKNEGKAADTEPPPRFVYLSVHCADQKFRELRSAQVSGDAIVAGRASQGGWISALPETAATEIIHAVCENAQLFTGRKALKAPNTSPQADG